MWKNRLFPCGISAGFPACLAISFVIALLGLEAFGQNDGTILREGQKVFRQLDQRRRPIWINEAQRSDVYYVRQYLDFVDITGCDIYPVKSQERPITRIGGGVERWKQVGAGMPVWMVLQAFSWHELGEYYGVKEPAYPTFSESQFMAYDAIIHGASGIL